ncbi:valine--pyruvate transaminase [Treponema sp.]|uniref:valine--pyruvate transaminase n=1 Tax=Treponema sp. TaxID=166 RepID=UPI00298E27A1|nr:valine--pyruvate transaminase [Treponema sp.]MCR5614426.1 valine--pyruvate transaminase [Treponema sp.]
MKNIEFSDFGKKLCGDSGILQLMDDLGKPLPPNIPTYQLGGGNPASIPEIEKIYRDRMEYIMNHGKDFENLIGRYDSPQGRVLFLEEVSSYLSAKFGWKIGPENIAVTNGSQSAFFYLFNLFSGTFSSSGKKKTIVLPLVPEYIGYADQGLERDTFVGIPATYTMYDDHTFKYNVDFEKLEDYLESHDNVGALCVSRPTNPTGNVLTNNEIHRLSELSKKYDIPLMVDNAYGLPWPDIIFDDNAIPYWDENVILSMSLSKIGLPSLRTGIIIADKKIITALSNLNAIAALASGSLGQAIAGPLIKDGTLIEAAKKYVKPFYLEKSQKAQEAIHKYFNGMDYSIHKSEGAIFLWLLINDLKVPTKEFYQQLKKKGVIVVPGEYFFFGNTTDGSTPPVEEHPHYSKCVRLNYSRPDKEVEEGIRLMAKIARDC